MEEPYAVVTASPIGPSVLRYSGSYMPPKFVNRMIYAETWGDTSAGGVTYYQYRMNSIYDPYVGAGGSGVHGIDELSAIYDRYLVRRATMTITASIQATEVTMLYAWPTAASTAPSINEAQSAPEVKSLMLSQYRPASLTIVGIPGRYESTSRDRDYTAQVGANPTIVNYFDILLKNTSAANLNVVLRVQIVYDVEWSVRKLVEDIDDA